MRRYTHWTVVLILLFSCHKDENFAPVITQQPASLSVVIPSQALFSVTASGSPAPTFQWQRNNGTDWINITGATKDSYLMAFTSPADNNSQFRVVAANSIASATSQSATLNVTPPLSCLLDTLIIGSEPGFVSKFKYDGTRRVLTKTVSETNSLASPITYTYSYNANGRVDKIVSSSGTSDQFGYNGEGSLSSVAHFTGNVLTYSDTYSWGTNSLEIKSPQPGVQLTSFTFTFSGANITKWVENALNPDGSIMAFHAHEFSDFDSAFSPEYILLLTTGGSLTTITRTASGQKAYFPVSMNNPASITEMLSGQNAFGSVTQCTYNPFKAVLKRKTTLTGSLAATTDHCTYVNCN